MLTTSSIISALHFMDVHRWAPGFHLSPFPFIGIQRENWRRQKLDHPSMLAMGVRLWGGVASGWAGSRAQEEDVRVALSINLLLLQSPLTSCVPSFFYIYYQEGYIANNRGRCLHCVNVSVSGLGTDTPLGIGLFIF